MMICEPSKPALLPYRFQYPWLTIATGAFVPGLSSSGRNARPSTGATPRTAK
jgi:hypothetical protein